MTETLEQKLEEVLKRQNAIDLSAFVRENEGAIKKSSGCIRLLTRVSPKTDDMFTYALPLVKGAFKDEDLTSEVVGASCDLGWITSWVTESKDDSTLKRCLNLVETLSFKNGQTISDDNLDLVVRTLTDPFTSKDNFMCLHAQRALNNIAKCFPKETFSLAFSRIRLPNNFADTIAIAVNAVAERLTKESGFINTIIPCLNEHSEVVKPIKAMLERGLLNSVNECFTVLILAANESVKVCNVLLGKGIMDFIHSEKSLRDNAMCWDLIAVFAKNSSKAKNGTLKTKLMTSLEIHEFRECMRDVICSKESPNTTKESVLSVLSAILNIPDKDCAAFVRGTNQSKENQDKGILVPVFALMRTLMSLETRSLLAACVVFVWRYIKTSEKKKTLAWFLNTKLLFYAIAAEEYNYTLKDKSDKACTDAVENIIDEFIGIEVTKNTLPFFLDNITVVGNIFMNKAIQSSNGRRFFINALKKAMDLWDKASFAEAFKDNNVIHTFLHSLIKCRDAIITAAKEKEDCSVSRQVFMYYINFIDKLIEIDEEMADNFVKEKGLLKVHKSVDILKESNEGLKAYSSIVCTLVNNSKYDKIISSFECFEVIKDIIVSTRKCSDTNLRTKALNKTISILNLRAEQDENFVKTFIDSADLAAIVGITFVELPDSQKMCCSLFNRMKPCTIRKVARSNPCFLRSVKDSLERTAKEKTLTGLHNDIMRTYIILTPLVRDFSLVPKKDICIPFIKDIIDTEKKASKMKVTDLLPFLEVYLTYYEIDQDTGFDLALLLYKQIENDSSKQIGSVNEDILRVMNMIKWVHGFTTGNSLKIECSNTACMVLKRQQCGPEAEAALNILTRTQYVKVSDPKQFVNNILEALDKADRPSAMTTWALGTLAALGKSVDEETAKRITSAALAVINRTREMNRTVAAALHAILSISERSPEGLEQRWDEGLLQRMLFRTEDISDECALVLVDFLTSACKRMRCQSELGKDTELLGRIVAVVSRSFSKNVLSRAYTLLKFAINKENEGNFSSSMAKLMMWWGYFLSYNPKTDNSQERPNFGNISQGLYRLKGFIESFLAAEPNKKESQNLLKKVSRSMLAPYKVPEMVVFLMTSLDEVSEKDYLTVKSAEGAGCSLLSYVISLKARCPEVDIDLLETKKFMNKMRIKYGLCQDTATFPKGWVIQSDLENDKTYIYNVRTKERMDEPSPNWNRTVNPTTGHVRYSTGPILWEANGYFVLPNIGKSAMDISCFKEDKLKPISTKKLLRNKEPFCVNDYEMEESFKSIKKSILTETFTALEEDDAYTIFAYTYQSDDGNDSIYSKVNTALAKRENVQVVKYKSYIMNLLSALRNLDPVYPEECYRGIKLHEFVNLSNYEVGKTLSWPGLTSTSLKKEKALNFVNRKGILFTIRGAHGYDICKYSRFPKEGEILLEPEVRYTIERIYPPGPINLSSETLWKIDVRVKTEEGGETMILEKEVAEYTKEREEMKFD